MHADSIPISIPDLDAGSSSGWICVGSVESKFVVIVNCGYPDGLYMHWRGPTHVFQTCEFLHWADLFNAISCRLRQAKLEWMALASLVPNKPGRPWCVDLVVLVRRFDPKVMPVYIPKPNDPK